MSKQIIYNEEARKKLKAGVDALARAVSTTLGPKGANVALDKSWGAPSVVNDGITIAKEIELKDKFENMGAQLLREAASKTNDVAGDGTTTATVIAQAVVEEGLKVLSAGGNAMILKKGLEKATTAVEEKIKEISKKISTKGERAQVATISAQDSAIGELIAEAMEKIGDDGVITVDEGKGFTIDLEYKEGMQFDKGYLSPYFVTNTDKMVCDIENPYILLTDSKISNIQELVPLLEKMVQAGSKSLVIIAEDVEGEALTTLVLNKLRGTINVLAIKAPGFGDRRKEMLQDIAILTGGTVISSEVGKKLENAEIVDLGKAEKVTSDKDSTVIVGGAGTEDAVRARVTQIETEMSNSTSDYDKEKMQERLAKLSGGVAVINVGAATETEMKDKKLRVEDAVNATKAAVEEGIVAGGGIALLRVREAINDLKLVGDEAVGAKILYDALDRPFRLIVQNAGGESGKVLAQLEALRASGKNENMGYDAMTEQFVDMVEVGITDPAKVTRSAVKNAVSVATMILTTECLVADIPEDKPATPDMGGGMGGMHGMM